MVLNQIKNRFLIKTCLKRLIFILIFSFRASIVVLAGTTDDRQVRLIVTSDQHGWLSTSMVYPQQKRRGLLHIIRDINAIKKKSPEAILVDAGDLLQGSPLVSFVHQMYSDPAQKDPFFRLVQSLGYDAVAVGNHDLGINPLFERYYVPESGFVWLAANLKRDGRQVFKPFTILRRYGLKIAVLGFSTPGVEMWLSSDQLNKIKGESIQTSARFWLKQIRERENPDLVIGVFHSGVYPLRDDENSKLNRIAPANAVEETLDRNRGFDLAIVGHDHRLSPTRSGNKVKYIYGTPVVEAGRWAEAFIDLTLLLGQTNGKWQVKEIKCIVHRASQDPALDSAYIKQLPGEYPAYINEPLPYIFTRTDRATALECLNLLNAKAHDGPSIVGSMLPYASVYQLADLFGQRVRRMELYKFFKHDNRTVTAMLSERDIQLLQQPEAEFGRRRIPGNRKLYSYFKKVPSCNEKESWWLKRQRFSRDYPVKISDYHHHGGGGTLAPIFQPIVRRTGRSSMIVRERLFQFLKRQPVLPDICGFLQPAGP